MKNTIPFILVNGFLGSGKTTFLKRLLKTLPKEQKIAVIQNEFAPSNIDGEELMQSTSESFELLEINNGSVFCVCLLGTFVKSLAEFIEIHQPETIIMEASGLSDPAGIAELFQSKDLVNKVYFNEAWCIVDAAHFEKIEQMNTRYRHQVQIADHVIINKTDRVGTEVTDKVHSRIRELNPFCKISKASYCTVDFTSIEHAEKIQVPELSKRLDTSNSEGRPSIHSGVLKMGIKVASKSLHKLFSNDFNNFIRIKGFFTTPEGKGYAIHKVHDDVDFAELEDYKGNLHLIFMGTDFSLGEIRKKLLSIQEKA